MHDAQRFALPKLGYLKKVRPVVKPIIKCNHEVNENIVLATVPITTEAKL
jgi:hypothetical protein